MCLYVNLSTFMCTVCAGTHGGQTRVSRLWELEFQVAVRGHVAAGNQTQVLCGSSKCSELLGQLFSPQAKKFTPNIL